MAERAWEGTVVGPYVEAARGATATELLADFDACKASVRALLGEARESVHYSTFICDPHVRLGTDAEAPTFGEAVAAACARGVDVTIAYNPASCYGNLSEAEFVAAVAPARVVSVRGSLGPAEWMLYFSNNASWSYHHQKYVVVDGGAAVMVTGCDLNEERAGWLAVNSMGYYWHELGAVVRLPPGPVRAAVGAWVAANTNGGVDPNSVPPPPLVSHATEASVMRALIAGAKSSIHLENQSFMSGSSSANGIAAAIVDRVARAVAEGDSLFRVVILTNMAQQDEPSFMTRLYCSASLLWSVRFMETRARAAGVSADAWADHVFVGFLEHDGTLVKVHSNILIIDSQLAIRSSSNLSDRSLSALPTDSELGIFCAANVAAFQSTLFNRYLGTAGIDYTFNNVFAAATQAEGIFRPVDLQLTRYPDVLNNALVAFLQSTPATGGKAPTTFSAVPGGTPVAVPEPKELPWTAIAVVILAAIGLAAAIFAAPSLTAPDVAPTSPV